MSRIGIERPQINGAPQPAGVYLHAVAASEFLYTPGSGPTDPVTGLLLETDVATAFPEPAR
jgi:hypothetical protein